MIRLAKSEDLDKVLELGKHFGHQMLYQKDSDLMSRYIDMSRVIVWEEEVPNLVGVFGGPPRQEGTKKEVTGFYHFILDKDPGFVEMLRCYREMPELVVEEAKQFNFRHSIDSKLCVCMQGGSHREVFREFIKWMQERYSHIWCYCSKKSARPQSYEELGFTFSPREQYTFFNIHKGDMSTYKLGRWAKKASTVVLKGQGGCPDCGNSLVYQEGCFKCLSCGYTKC